MTTAIVPGSVADMASLSGASLAQSFLTVDALVICDVSGSMSAHDAPGDISRYEAACQELANLQGKHPGKIGVVAFSDRAEFVPGGVPPMIGNHTNMVAALRYVQVADGLGIRLILLSDGAPDDPDATIALARSFQTHIDCVYIGPERDHGGRAFLERLAAATGGKFAQSEAPGMLEAPVMLLLEGK